MMAFDDYSAVLPFAIGCVRSQSHSVWSNLLVFSVWTNRLLCSYFLWWLRGAMPPDEFISRPFWLLLLEHLAQLKEPTASTFENVDGSDSGSRVSGSHARACSNMSRILICRDWIDHKCTHLTSSCHIVHFRNIRSKPRLLTTTILYFRIILFSREACIHRRMIPDYNQTNSISW